MTSAAAESREADPIVPVMFEGSSRLRWVMPMLRSLPAPLARQLLAGLAIGDAVVRTERLRQARAWAAAQARHRPAAWRLTLALLANHGRFAADEAMIGVDDTGSLRRRVVITGREHLDACTAGAILLGFHLGPPRTAFILRAHGYRVHLTGQLEGAAGNARWDDALRSAEAVRLPAGAPRGRAEGLRRIRTLLRDGDLVYLAADGPFGREAFRIDVPGRPLIARLGWFTLRRLTRVPTLPVLTYWEDDRRVIAIHPPLPEPDVDQARDADACRAILTPLIEEYVRRYPSQCRYLAFPSWAADASAPPGS